MPLGQLKGIDFPIAVADRCGVPMMVTASRDPSCLGRAKYIYRFVDTIKETIARVFLDCETKAVRFSKIVPQANDLLKINKKDEFQADIVIGGLSITVYFADLHEAVHLRTRELFEHRLYKAGYGYVTLITAQNSHCDRCPVNHLKKCSP